MSEPRTTKHGITFEQIDAHEWESTDWRWVIRYSPDNGDWCVNDYANDTYEFYRSVDEVIEHIERISEGDVARLS